MMKPASSHPAHRIRGSVLLLVLWALLLLSSVVFAWVKSINQDVVIIHQENSGLDARALAHSGAWIAMHPLVSNTSPLLNSSFGPSRGYKVKMTGEGGKLNLNWLLQPEDSTKRLLLDNYLALRGLSQRERATLIDSMLDWTQPGNTHHLNGMQDSPTYKNAHRPFSSLDEVEKVNGSGPLVSQSGWKNDFSLYSQGPVDLQWASLQVLESIPGVGEMRAIRFINIRKGPDHLDGTNDDYVFKNDEIRSYLGLDENQFEKLKGLVGTKDPAYHILSEGYSGDVKRSLEVIAKKTDAAPVILYWKDI